MPDQDLLDVYLSDHFAGATAGLQLAERMADSQPEAAALRQIAEEIEADREKLHEVMGATGVKPPLLKSALGWLGEKAGRLKLNERVFGHSPLSDVLELEGLIAGVSGKLQLWRALTAVAEGDSRLARFDFAALAARAEDQRTRLEELHRKAVGRALQGGLQ
jgi:hypothetical protein